MPRPLANPSFSVAQSVASRLFPLQEPSALAEPWRRLLAAAIDTVIILAAHVIVIGVEYSTVGDSDRFDRLLAIFSPLFCWLYVFAGWSIGSTIGMRFTKIRLATEHLAPMRPAIAIKRMVAFVIACLPVKLGLAPILWDARRQGWHDKMAGTLVVKADARPGDPLPARDRPPDLAPAPRPDIAAPIGLCWIALPLYAALVVWMTWPSVLHLNTKVMGMPADAFIFIWDYWYFLHALTTHQSLVRTNLIFFPHTSSLALHTMLWFNCAIAAPLQSHIGLLAAYNVLNLASMTACALACFWFTSALGAGPVAALIAGGAFGVSPYFMTHCLGDANLLAAEFLPLYALCTYALLVTRRRRYIGWSALWLALTGYCDLQYLAFGVTFGIVLLVGYWLYHERPPRDALLRQIGGFALATVIAGVLLAPIAVPAVNEMREPSVVKFRLAASIVNRADVADWYTPSPSSRLFGGNFRLVAKDSDVSPGLTMSLLAVAAAAFCWRKRRLWAFVIGVFAILASGPILTWHGRNLSVWGLVAFGFPGTSFGLPWDTSASTFTAIKLFTDPRTLATEGPPMIMPYSWLASVVPLFSPFRFPSRFAVIVLMCVALLAGQGLTELMDRLKGKYRRLPGALAAVAASAALAECYCPPYPMYAPPAVPFYRRVAAEPGSGAIVEQPLAGDEISAYGQTVHHRPLFKSFISRHTKNQMSLIASNFFLVNGALATRPDYEQRMRDAVMQLKRLGAEYVVYQTGGAPDRLGQAASFARVIKAPVAYNDGNTIAFRIDRL